MNNELLLFVLPGTYYWLEMNYYPHDQQGARTLGRTGAPAATAGCESISRLKVDLVYSESDTPALYALVL